MIRPRSKASTATGQKRASSDYARVERAIRYLEENHLAQPTLAEVAETVGLSEFHFQRLFQRWAGVTPKSFLQFITLAHAKEVVSARKSLLESSLAVGLSGPSRLHDLFITTLAMTPGEFRSCGQGMELGWAVHPTPFGDALFVATDRGLSALHFVGEQTQAIPILEELKRKWPGAKWRRADALTARYADELAARVRGQPPRPLSLLLRGTPFQLKVWEALLRIPEGQTLSYDKLSGWAGAPGAARAVGSAVGANPIAYFIPCHRVIRAGGAIGGYRWGESRKRTLLALEQARGVE